MKEMLKEMREALVPIYGKREAEAMIKLIFHAVKGWSPTDMIIHEGDELSEFTTGWIRSILDRLRKEEPLQYILGKARFQGMDFTVDRRVLIPRPETSELVDLIVDRNKGRKDLRILDIGTGSGCIAISLAKALPFSNVWGMDISRDALDVASENAQALKGDVKLFQADVFEYLTTASSFDIMVSNPPYIDESEKNSMEKNVVAYEPAEALFVPDATPLIYYSRISDIAARGLVAGGELWFEINPRHADTLKRMLLADGFVDVEILNDSYGKQRFIFARKRG